jgi:hypothetical protein
VGLINCGLRATLGTEAQLLVMVLSSSFFPRDYHVIGVAIILHKVSTGKFVNVGLRGLSFRRSGVTDKEEFMEAFLGLFTEREVDIF